MASHTLGIPVAEGSFAQTRKAGKDAGSPDRGLHILLADAEGRRFLPGILPWGAEVLLEESEIESCDRRIKYILSSL